MYSLKTSVTGLLIQFAKVHAGYREKVSLGQWHFCAGAPRINS